MSANNIHGSVGAAQRQAHLALVTAVRTGNGAPQTRVSQAGAGPEALQGSQAAQGARAALAPVAVPFVSRPGAGAYAPSDVRVRPERAPVIRPAPAQGRNTYHEVGVRAVANMYSRFEDALIPMVLASGVNGDAASAVARAIRSNPQLRVQAENAFRAARMGPAGDAGQ